MFYACHRVPGVLKINCLSWATMGSYIAGSKLHMFTLTSSFSTISYTARYAPLFLRSQSSYIQNLKLHTLAFLLPSSQNNKQTNPLGMILARICSPEIVH